jgi:hypothetical protein
MRAVHFRRKKTKRLKPFFSSAVFAPELCGRAIRSLTGENFDCIVITSFPKDSCGFQTAIRTKRFPIENSPFLLRKPHFLISPHAKFF